MTDELVLRLTRDAYDDIVSHGQEGGDEEVCGVLAGAYGESASAVRETRRATNVADRARLRYEMDSEEQFALIEQVEDDGLEVVGFYHSHPTGPPRPSETDAEGATWPGYSYVICALEGYPYLGSWRWTGETFERETVALI